MPIGTLWTDLMLNGAPFKKSLINATREVATWAQRTKKEFREAFKEEIGGRRGFVRARNAARDVGREIAAMGEAAQLMQAQFDLPADKLLALQEVSRQTGISMQDLVANLDQAAGLMSLLGKHTSFVSEEGLRAGSVWATFGKIFTGLITGRAAHILGMVTKFIAPNWMKIPEQAAAQARSLAEDIRHKAALPGILRGRAAEKLTRAGELAPTIGSAGPLASIGGFTGGAGIGTLHVQKQQLDVLKLIEKHTELTNEALRLDPMAGL